MKTRVTMYLENEVIGFFKGMSDQSGIPYQTLINYCLVDLTRKKVGVSIQFLTQEEQENLEDLREFQMAIEEFKKNPITYTHEEMMKMIEDGENDV